MRYGISANNIHSTSFDCTMTDRQIGAPEKVTAMEAVPGMSGYYDFTELFGSATYSKRTLTYTFSVGGRVASEVEQSVTGLVDWLSRITDDEIYDDLMPGYHFVGTCSKLATKASASGRRVDVTATFTCHPFRISSSGAEVI